DVTCQRQRPGPSVADACGGARNGPVPVRAVAAAYVDEIVRVLARLVENDGAVLDGSGRTERARLAEIGNRREEAAADAVAAAKRGRAGVRIGVVAQRHAIRADGNVAVPGDERRAHSASLDDQCAAVADRHRASRVDGTGDGQADA